MGGREVERIEVNGCEPSYEYIRENYISKNIPFILTGDACVGADGRAWGVFNSWLTSTYSENTGYLDVDYIRETYGEDTVPVAKCNEEMYGAHPKVDMKFSEYLSALQKGEECLYLKDYHFVRAHSDVDLYVTPLYFTSDWLNEFCVDKQTDDYRFVYIGPRGSWTPFHADVLRSFSWSANVCGKKQWILYPPGVENLLKDKLGNLPLSVMREPYNSADHPTYGQRTEAVQNSGEVLFVPTGWHHEVHNLETTLSINHNWFNGCNVSRCWTYLQDSLGSVQKEIKDCVEMDNWHEHCQVLLRAYLGFNYQDFYDIVTHIGQKRLDKPSLPSSDGDVSTILQMMKIMSSDKHVAMIDSLKVSCWKEKLQDFLDQ